MKKFENWRYQENKRSPDFEDKKEKKKKKMIVGKLKQLNKLVWSQQFNSCMGSWKIVQGSNVYLHPREVPNVIEAYDPGLWKDHMKVNLYWSLKIFMFYVKPASRKWSLLKLMVHASIYFRKHNHQPSGAMGFLYCIMDQNMSNIGLIYLYLADLDADPAVVERNIKSKTK